MANHWRNAVDGEEELYFNRVVDTILKVIEPECTTSQGVSHEYDPLAVQMTLQGFGDKGDPGRLLGCDMAKLTTYVDGSTHVDGTAELGSWEDVDEVSVPVEGHQPEDYGEIEDPPYRPRNPLPKQRKSKFHEFLPPVLHVLIPCQHSGTLPKICTPGVDGTSTHMDLRAR
jgi:hypothetical protein